MSDDRNRTAWSLRESVDYYVAERTRVADLYESEANMLLPVVPYIHSVLDVGCAVGNSLQIFRELKPDIVYTGVDIADGMIEEARARHPNVEFHLGSGNRLPFPAASFDLVFCTGVLNHNPEYYELLREVLRVTRRFAVVDLPRVVPSPYQFDLSHSFMELGTRFAVDELGHREAESRVPYVLAAAEQLFQDIPKVLSEGLSGFGCYGYYGRPHVAVTIPFSVVVFAVALFVKGREPLQFWLHLPEDVRMIAHRLLSAHGASAETLQRLLR